MSYKFLKELETLIEEGVISTETAIKIRQHYAAKKDPNPNRLFTVFGVLGSLLVGLGIILILAHNWDNFSKTIKTVIAFIPLVIGQALAGFSIFKKKSATWKEASGTFLFFAVGASISLISQIYNIPGNMPSFLLTWTLLCAPLMYLLRSKSLALLHIVFTTYYATQAGYGYGSNTPWLYIPLLAIVVPFYYQMWKTNKESNMVSVFNWLVPLSLIIVLGGFISKFHFGGFLMYMMLFGLFYNLGKTSWLRDQSLLRNGYLVLGSLGTVFLLIILSFRDLWKHIADDFSWNAQEIWVSLVLASVALAVLVYNMMQRPDREFNVFKYVFLLFVPMFFIGLYYETVIAIVINTLVLALGVFMTYYGGKKLHFGLLNYGLLIITILIICRFFDTDLSFVLRGLLFVAIGVGFFLANYLMLKRQKLKS